jgi:hypothetical protein
VPHIGVHHTLSLTGIEEHCRLVKGRSKLSEGGKKRIMRFYFNLRMNDLPLRNGVCIV